jgi:hypothetical protein
MIDFFSFCLASSFLSHMINFEMKNQLPSSSEDLVEAAIKGVVSAIPVVGGLIAELGSCLGSPLEKRKRAWSDEVEAALAELASKHQRLPHALAEDPSFVSALLKATRAALATHQKLKIAALRSFLVAIGAKKVTDEELQEALIKLLEELSVGHIEVLSFLEAEYCVIAKEEKLEAVFDLYHSACKGQFDRMTFRWMLADLASRMVIHLGDLEDMDEFATQLNTYASPDSKVRPLQITQLGKQLLGVLRN